MATVVFANGDELIVTADADAVLDQVTEAQRSGAKGLPTGWIRLTTAEDQHDVTAQTAQIAYIRP